MDNHQASSSFTRKNSFIAWTIFLFLVALGGTYLVLHKNTLSTSRIPMPGEGERSLPSLVFDGTTYLRVNTFPTSQDLDLVSESYEWAPQGDSGEMLSSLITTHKMSSKDKAKPISAKVYAENVAAMNEKQGATVIETSIINTSEAVKEAGIDTSNPPYLLVYAFPTDGTRPIEVDIQKVINGPDGTIEAFIYAFPLNAKTDQEVVAFFKSDEFLSKRAEVIRAAFPY